MFDPKEDQGTAIVTTTPTNVVPIVPLRNTVIFPGQMLPLSMGREMSVKSVEEAVAGDRRIVVVAQHDSHESDPSTEALHVFGTLADILKIIRLPDGSQTVIVQGKSRVRILDYVQTKPNLRGLVQIHDEPSNSPEPSVEIDALVQSLRTTYLRVVELAPYLATEHAVMAHNTDSPGQLADLVVSTLQVDLVVKQSILETLDVGERLRRVNEIASRELEVFELSSKIQSKVQGEMSKTHKQYVLREQLKAIKAELGEESDDDDEIEKLRERIEAAGFPAEARKAADEALARLERTQPASPEYGVARTYLEWLLDLPWTQATVDRLELGEARAVLDRDHWGLDKIKKRIIEFLAIRKLKADVRGPILCFVGPPGVGKTSLGRSIAEALGRKFVRISLGGIRDEAEIRGHRRTYIGSLPGRVLQGMKRAGTVNPVFVLDEIDKLVMDFHGDPSAALLEVLDPEQNATFSDHYLEVPYDLSKVLFIATANQGDPIPAALRDRMEIIQVTGYTTEDKVHIAETHLLPKVVRDHGLEKRQVSFTKSAIEQIITDYTRESGVRTLDRTIASVVRGVACEIAEGKVARKTVHPEDLVTYLGQKKFESETADRTRHPGVATGLAWTPFGGDILFIEATRMSGQGRLNITGQLGDVMKESAQAALSYLRSQAENLGLPNDFIEKTDVHIHVPAGAVPKDGPSAGVALFTALVSLFLGRPVKRDVAMTGEITLRGLVLPVGGIKEKVLAARRAGIKTVILPERNRGDLDEIPEELRKSMRFVFARDVGQVLTHALSRRKVKARPLQIG